LLAAFLNASQASSVFSLEDGAKPNGFQLIFIKDPCKEGFLSCSPQKWAGYE
jgi:hypothetical protein